MFFFLYVPSFVLYWKRNGLLVTCTFKVKTTVLWNDRHQLWGARNRLCADSMSLDKEEIKNTRMRAYLYMYFYWRILFMYMCFSCSVCDVIRYSVMQSWRVSVIISSGFWWLGPHCHIRYGFLLNSHSWVLYLPLVCSSHTAHVLRRIQEDVCWSVHKSACVLMKSLMKLREADPWQHGGPA